jgi:hypothetical protein
MHVSAGTCFFILAQTLLILRIENSWRTLFYLVLLLKSLRLVLSHVINKITNRNFWRFLPPLDVFLINFAVYKRTIPHNAGGVASQRKLSEFWHVVSRSNCVTSGMQIANSVFYSWCFSALEGLCCKYLARLSWEWKWQVALPVYPDHILAPLAAILNTEAVYISEITET